MVAIGGNIVVVTQRPNGRPGAPTAFGARAARFNVTFSWGSPLTDGDATSYVIEAGLAPGTTFISLPEPGTSRTVNDVPPGRYFLRVRGVNEFGTGPPSTEFELVVEPTGVRPAAPGSFVVSMAGRRLTASWTAPETGGNPTGYLIEAGFAVGQTAISIALGNVLVFNYAEVPDGFYFLRVRAVNEAGAGPPSEEILLTVGNVPAPPGPPANLIASVSGSTVALAWTAPSGGTLPSGYIIEAGSSPGASNLAIYPTGSTGLAISFSGVPPGTYHVRVRGANAQGAGLASNEVVVVVP
jgi:hypothetical protein